jgi:hypothetical protein
LQASTFLDLQKILLAALLTGLAAYLHQLWKYNRNAYQARVDETCELIFNQADAGAKYWITPKRKTNKLRSENFSTTDHEAIAAEVAIDGRLRELQFLRLMLEERITLQDRDLLRELMASFQDAMTGGDFGAQTRAEDTERAKQVYRAACDLVAHIRAAADRDNKLWRSIIRFLESQLPYRRPSTHRGRIEEAIFLLSAGALFVFGTIFCAFQFWLWSQ